MFPSKLFRYPYLSRIRVNNGTNSTDLSIYSERPTLHLSYFRTCIEHRPELLACPYKAYLQPRFNHTSVGSGAAEKIDPVTPTLKIGKLFSTRIALTKGEAIEWEEGQRDNGVMIYTDGSGVDGKVGAAAVMYRNGTLERCLQFHLGSQPEYTTLEGELLGILLGVHLLHLSLPQKPEAIINTDSQTAVGSLLTKGELPAKYLFSQIISRIYTLTVHCRTSDQAMSKHTSPPLTITWIPGHQKIPGNVEADLKAKEAARGVTSNPKDLPRKLRTSNWRERLSAISVTKRPGL